MTTQATTENLRRRNVSCIEIRQLQSPLPCDLVWQVESFLLKIFEYGNYSFRSALAGTLDTELACVFRLAMLNNEIIGAAGCLYSKTNSQVALFGPIAVAPEHRRKGVGTILANAILQHLAEKSCQAAYLGVIQSNPARKLYHKLGFQSLSGVVMQYLFCHPAEFHDFYFSTSNDHIKIRPMRWADFCGVQTLLTSPLDMCSFDFQQGIFSSKYAPLHTFLPVFPTLAACQQNQTGLAQVLATASNEKIMGIAHVTYSKNEITQHVGTLDFFIHDNFINHSLALLQSVLERCQESEVTKLNCFVPQCDHIKQHILKQLKAAKRAILPDNILIDNHYQDVIVYEL